MTLIVTPEGIITKSKEISLKKNEIMGISKFNLKDEKASYAFRFVIYENIEDL